jgi:hypothetical protein
LTLFPSDVLNLKAKFKIWWQLSTRVKPTGAPGGATLSWLLDTRLDRSNNNVLYSYTINNGSGENLLSRISYTGLASAAGNRFIDFTYEARTDRSSSYLFGALSEQTKRLQSISTRVGASVVRSYALVYEASGTSARSLLKSVQECASGKCLSANTFDWDNVAVGFDAAPLDRRGWDTLPRPSGVGALWTYSPRK